MRPNAVFNIFKYEENRRSATAGARTTGAGFTVFLSERRRSESQFLQGGLGERALDALEEFLFFHVHVGRDGGFEFRERVARVGFRSNLAKGLDALPKHLMLLQGAPRHALRAFLFLRKGHDQSVFLLEVRRHIGLPEREELLDQRKELGAGTFARQRVADPLASKQHMEMVARKVLQGLVPFHGVAREDLCAADKDWLRSAPATNASYVRRSKGMVGHGLTASSRKPGDKAPDPRRDSTGKGGMAKTGFLARAPSLHFSSTAQSLAGLVPKRYLGPAFSTFTIVSGAR